MLLVTSSTVRGTALVNIVMLTRSAEWAEESWAVQGDIVAF